MKKNSVKISINNLIGTLVIVGNDITKLQKEEIISAIAGGLEKAALSTATNSCSENSKYS